MALRPPRVLVLTLSFGSGHLRAAAAVVEALRRDAPDADVRIVDALDGCNPLFRALYVWPYWLMVRYAPRLWARFFEGRLHKRSDTTAPVWAFRFGCGRAFRAIEDFNPDVILAAEVAACEIATIARHHGLTAAPTVALITDHHAEPAWVKPGVYAYAVASEAVRRQLAEWGAPPDRISVTGIPTSAQFQAVIDVAAVRSRHGVPDGRPMVLLMGGGMGPTHMDDVAVALCASGRRVHVVAVAGHDRRVRARLEQLAQRFASALTVRGWVEDAASLMKAASVLVTKPGGLTTAEAAVCGVPMVMFDPIPGPEEHNASRVARAGAGILARGSDETVAAVGRLLDDERARAAMAARGRELAAPGAAHQVARLLDEARSGHPRTLIFTIKNGAGHTRAAEAIATALDDIGAADGAAVIDVANFMSFTTRLTHVHIYLWLVRHAPAVWKRIDRFQKRRRHTSPEWYYRRGCRRLFDFVRRAQPGALAATEVGCCEIAALIKRDLGLAVPLVAVNGEYDADRAWVQPEVDLYTVAAESVRDELVAKGAPKRAVRVWGVPLAPEFLAPVNRRGARETLAARLALNPSAPIVLVSGGSEGLGKLDEIAARLLALERPRPHVIVLAGRSEEVRRRCEALGDDRLRVMGWTTTVRELMEAADVMVTKPGHTFDEAIATELPMIVLPPPPGSEQVQYRLLQEWGVGRAVRTLDDMAAAVMTLLEDPAQLEAHRAAAARQRDGGAAARIARWIADEIDRESRSFVEERSA